jgi:hypothetical protein
MNMRDNLHLLPTGLKEEEHIRLLTKLKRSKPPSASAETDKAKPLVSLQTEKQETPKSVTIPVYTSLPSAAEEGSLVVVQNRLYFYTAGAWRTIEAVAVPVQVTSDFPSTASDGELAYVNDNLWVAVGGTWYKIPSQYGSFGTSLPTSAYTGDLFYHTDEKQLYAFDGSSWLPADLRILFGSSFPSSPTAGQLFYRTDQKRLYAYNGTDWVAQDAVQTASSDPASGVVGELYFNTSTNKLKVYTGSTWQEIGAGGGGGVGFGTSFPSSPTTGQLFYRTDQKRLYAYDGTNWVAQEAIQTVSSAPSSPVAGQMWYITSGNLIQVYTNATRTLAFDDNTTPIQTNTTSGSATPSIFVCRFISKSPLQYTRKASLRETTM